MAEENITLDPEYADLIIEVNKLKDKVAEKIAQRDMLAFHIVPDIENAYYFKIGFLENEVFLANIKLLKINRKIEVYKEKKRLKQKINEEYIEEIVDTEFSEMEEEFEELQDEYDFEFEELFDNQSTEEFLKLVNIIYKNLIKKLSPLINFNNSRFCNQLYDLLEKAYRELDLSLMSKIQVICEQVRIDSNFMIGDMKTLKRAKSQYEDIIFEIEEIILSIKCSDAFSKKRILEDENLIRRMKEEINSEIAELEEKYREAELILEELKKEE